MMLLRELMLDDLAIGLTVVRGGHEVVPSWHLFTPDEDFRVLMRFNPERPEQRERMLNLMPRFMAWKMATAFVLTVETWLGPAHQSDEAVVSIGVSHQEQLGVMQRIRRLPQAPAFGAPEWLSRDQLDPVYFTMLPTGVTEVTPEEAAMLAGVFGETSTAAQRPS